MKLRGIVLTVVALAMPYVAWAGQAAPRGIPTLGETGLIVLGVAMVGTGLVVLRRRKK